MGHSGEHPNATPAIVFDDGKGILGPLTDFRAAFDVRTGAMRTIERLRMHLRLNVVALYCPEPLEALTKERHSIPVNTFPETDLASTGAFGVISGRMAVPIERARELAPGQALVEQWSGDLIAAICTRQQFEELVRSGWDAAAAGLETVTLEASAASPALISRPWHAVGARNRSLEYDLRFLTRRKTGFVPRHVSIIGDKANLIIDPSATIRPGVVFDVAGGPVVVSKGAEIRPNAVLIGPTAIGPQSMVKEHSLIRATTCIGPVCKVAGEMGALTMQGYTNKGHEGYLGDAWLGEWVNLGAGTTASNLMNTYSEISAVAEPGGRREPTGEVFLGPIIGDHVKTAISTRIMTGSILGTGSMWAATKPVTGFVRAFTWATDAGEKPYRYDRFEQVMRASMGRRESEPSVAYLDRLRERHATLLA